MNSTDLDPRKYGPAIATLLGDRLPALGPGNANESFRPRLAALTTERLFADRQVVDLNAAECCLAGLWLWHDFLDESHRLSQEIDSIEGSYWHGIMHRREPDYGNAQYWFRRVGRHPVFEPLAAAARELAGQVELDAPAEFLAGTGRWDPFQFVDLCEAIVRGRSQCEQLAREVARAEWRLLFDHCFRQATGQL